MTHKIYDMNSRALQRLNMGKLLIITYLQSFQNNIDIGYNL